MSSRRRRKSAGRDSVVISVASMGDIVFLLLIFFILTTKPTEDNLKTVLPTGPDYAEIEKSAFSVVVDAAGDYYLNGERYPSAEGLGAQLEGLLAETTPEKRIVTLRCDREIDQDVFMPVIEAIAEAGGKLSWRADKRGTSVLQAGP